jgi:tRNA wybutosine-synthesizing protein 3
MSTEISFDKAKKDILKDIQNGVDWSPKGSIDAPVRELVAFINNLPDYVTTSSCSGRISCFRDNNRTKGIEWLLVKHRTITLSEIYDSVHEKQTIESTSDIGSTNTTAIPLVMLKCEPFILHVQCRSVASAQQLHRLGMGCGYRESGIGLGQKKTMVAIRTSAFSMELPVAIGHSFMLDQAALSVIVSECNRKLLANFSRIDRLLQNLKEEYIWPIFVCEPLLGPLPGGHVASEQLQYREQAFYGHSSVLIQPPARESKTAKGGKGGPSSAALVTVGGSGSTGRSVRPHSMNLSSEQTSPSVTRELTVSNVNGTVHSASLTCPVLVREVAAAPHVFVLDPLPRSLKREDAAAAGGVSSEHRKEVLAERRFQMILVSGGRKSPVSALPAVSGAFLFDSSSSSASFAPSDDSSLSPGGLHSREVFVTEEGDVPAARWGHSLVAYDSCRWILAGGRDGGRVFADAYVLEVVPTAHAGAGVLDQVADAASSRVFATLHWTRLQAALPTPRFFHAMCNTQKSSAALLLCGGLDEAALRGDPSPSPSDGEMYVLTLPSFATDSSCMYDEVDDVRVDTHVLAAKLRWNTLTVDGEITPGYCNRFGHTLTYIGANSIAVIGGSTFDVDFESDNVNATNTIEVWDISTVDPAAAESSLTGSSWSKFSSEEVHCSFTVSLRYICVDSSNAEFGLASLELGLGGTRSHHQALFQEDINCSSRTIDSRLIVTGGGVDCPALFGSHFSPSLCLRVTSRFLSDAKLKCPSASRNSSNVEMNDNKVGAVFEKKATCLVMLVPKSRVRGIKVFLEANKWLDKSTRISPVVDSTNKCVTQMRCSLPFGQDIVETELNMLDSFAHDDMMAVPVAVDFFDLFSNSTSLISKDDYSALYALLVLPIPEATGTASQRKKKSKMKQGAGGGISEPAGEMKSQPLDVSDELRVMSILFSEQDCNLNKATIASFGMTGEFNAVSSPQQSKRKSDQERINPKINKTNVSAQQVQKKELLSAANCEKKESCLVLLVPKSRVRGVKVYLETNKWLHKGTRISPAVHTGGGDAVVHLNSSLAAGEAEVRSEMVKLSSVSSVYPDDVVKDVMAVPITSSFYEMFAISTFGGVVATGSVASLISRKHFSELYALLVLPIPETTDTASERKKKSKLKKGELEARGPLDEGDTDFPRLVSMVFAQQSCSVNKAKAASGHVKAVEYFQSFIPEADRSILVKDIPSKFEIVGDVVMVPEGCLENQLWDSVINESFWAGLLSCFNHDDAASSKKFTRIARKARIDPGLKRESRVRLLYPAETHSNDTKQESAGPDGVGWTEVTENGITFGFDITKVM